MHESQFVLYSMRNKNISNVICLFYGYVGSCLHFRTKQHSQPWPLTIPHQCLLSSQQLYFPNRGNDSRLYSCVLQRERLLYFIAGRYYMLPIMLFMQNVWQLFKPNDTILHEIGGPSLCHLLRHPNLIFSVAVEYLDGMKDRKWGSFSRWAQVSYWKDMEQEEMAKKQRTTGNETNMLLTGLEGNMQYLISVKGFNSVGQGPSSSAIRIRTKKNGESWLDFHK